MSYYKPRLTGWFEPVVAGFVLTALAIVGYQTFRLVTIVRDDLAVPPESPVTIAPDLLNQIHDLHAIAITLTIVISATLNAYTAPWSYTVVQAWTIKSLWQPSLRLIAANIVWMLTVIWMVAQPTTVGYMATYWHTYTHHYWRALKEAVYHTIGDSSWLILEGLIIQIASFAAGFLIWFLLNIARKKRLSKRQQALGPG